MFGDSLDNSHNYSEFDTLLLLVLCCNHSMVLIQQMNTKRSTRTTAIIIIKVASLHQAMMTKLV
jgi:hypothetical protein